MYDYSNKLNIFKLSNLFDHATEKMKSFLKFLYLFILGWGEKVYYIVVKSTSTFVILIKDK